MFDEDIHKLTIKHPWMSFEDGWLLLKWSYEKNKDQKKYGGIKTVRTLMSIDYGIYYRQSEEWLSELLDEAREKFSY